MKWKADSRQLALSLLIAAVTGVMWATRFLGALNYQEQYQLFLWTRDYFARSVSLPGGLADWLGEFFTQFNYIPALGAAFIAILFFILQRLTWMAMKAMGVNGWYGLSFVPMLLLWLYQSDPNVLQSLTIALIAAMAAVAAMIVLVRRLRPHIIVSVIGVIILFPVFYWLFGTAVYILAVAVLIESIRKKKIIQGIIAAIYSIAVVYAASYLLPYPIERLLTGLHYYRYPIGVPAMQWIVLSVAAAIPYIASLLPALKSAVGNIILSIVILAIGGTAIWHRFDDETHTMLNYDFLVRTEQWDAILDRAERTPATSPMTVSIVNLALSQRGLLLDKLFHYYQNGSEGLFPTFTRDILSPVPTAEVFFRLGMVNDCVRYCFEAMQSIPDHRLSGRLLKRITQCEIANGHYDVARRYLLQLSRSTFYRKWAKSTLALIDDEQRINDNPVYARLRENREENGDYLFSEREMDQMTGLLLMNNPKNRMAYEYLIAYELLQRDLAHFSEYYILGRNIDYSRIPTAVQETLIGQWLQTHSTLQGIPFTLDKTVVDDTVDFIRTYMANRNDPRLSLPPLSYNAWRYILK